MTELENIKSLEKYDAWNKAKESRKSWLSFIALGIGTIIGLLLTWLILRVSPKDNWTLGKALFASTDKVEEHLPKINEVEEKLKKSIVATPLNWLSKKVEEEAAGEVLKGNLGAALSAIRTYAGILIVIWILVWSVIYTIIYYLSRWIIGSFVWKEPTLTESFIKEKNKEISL